jgi:hypothetical protein
MSQIITLEQGNDLWIKERRLGKAPAKASPKTLLFADYLKKAEPEPPKEIKFWRKRKEFPTRSFGNTAKGSCTRSKQAIMAMRMQRLEQNHTFAPTDDEVLRVYFEMTQRRYGGGDTGAYEEDALSDWRKPELTFRLNDKPKTPHIIDGFARINHLNLNEMKTAVQMSKAHGIAICFNLPWAWSSTYHWDLPAGTQMVGPWVPGSWGGHSMAWVNDYNEQGLWIYQTWDVPPGFVTCAGLL